MAARRETARCGLVFLALYLYWSQPDCLCCDWLFDVDGLRPVLSLISFLIAFFISPSGTIYHAPLLVLLERGERKVYRLARCGRAVVDSRETATGIGKVYRAV